MIRVFMQVGADGLLWVWPEAGPAAESKAASTPSISPPMADVIFLTPWYVRDAPFNADVLAENVLDPSHVAFSHHGYLGNRYKVQCPAVTFS